MAMERENKAPRAGAPANRKRRKVCQFCVDKCEYISTTRMPLSCAASFPSAPRSCPVVPPAPVPCISVS